MQSIGKEMTNKIWNFGDVESFGAGILTTSQWDNPYGDVEQSLKNLKSWYLEEKEKFNVLVKIENIANSVSPFGSKGRNKSQEFSSLLDVLEWSESSDDDDLEDFIQVQPLKMKHVVSFGNQNGFAGIQKSNQKSQAYSTPSKDPSINPFGSSPNQGELNLDHVKYLESIISNLRDDLRNVRMKNRKLKAENV